MLHLQPGFLGEVVLACTVGTALAELVYRLVQLPDLVGIFPAEMTGEQVHFQLPQPSKSQPVVMPIGDKKTGLIAGDHPLAHEYHHFMLYLLHLISTIYFQRIHAFSVLPCGASPRD